MFKVGDRVRLTKYIMGLISCKDEEYRIIYINSDIVTLDRRFCVNSPNVSLYHNINVAHIYSVRDERKKKLKEIMGSYEHE